MTESTQQTFWRIVTDDGRNPCAMKGMMTRSGQPKRCSPLIDAHHFVPKRRLKLNLGYRDPERLDRALGDTRNGVALCRDHHDLVEAGALESPAPVQLLFFLHEFGLTQNPKIASSVGGSRLEVEAQDEPE